MNNTGINPVYGPMVESTSGGTQARRGELHRALSWVQQAHRAWLTSTAAPWSTFLGRGDPAGTGHRVLRCDQGDADPLTEVLAVELGPGIRVNAGHRPW